MAKNTYQQRIFKAIQTIKKGDLYLTANTTFNTEFDFEIVIVHSRINDTGYYKVFKLYEIDFSFMGDYFSIINDRFNIFCLNLGKDHFIGNVFNTDIIECLKSQKYDKYSNFSLLTLHKSAGDKMLLLSDLKMFLKTNQ